MATFKAGDKVRIIANYRYPNCDPVPDSVIGMEARITEVDPDIGDDAIYALHLPGHGRLWFAAVELAPLTDPDAERFVESIKRLAREPINVAPKLPVKSEC